MVFAALETFARGGGDELEWIFPLLFLLLIGGLVAWLFQRRRGGPAAGGSAALATLQARFASGEIDHAEFAHRRAVLDGDDDVPPAPPRRSPGDE